MLISSKSYIFISNRIILNNSIHTFHLSLDWKLINLLSKIDRFDASWTAIEKREGKNLKHLKAIATVKSTGSSTRIEGAAMTDKEVSILIKNLDTSKLEERDAQEVAGYFRALEMILDSFAEINITESNIKSLHNTLLKFSVKDEWHKGGYKQLNNEVEAMMAGGMKHTIFKTKSPGFETESAMQSLIDWYQADSETHHLIKTAAFCYDFVSIHPFQDGNGRMSRLLATLLLLQKGYKWIEYISFEHEIENRKVEYYQMLMLCQQQRPGENIYPWVVFFLDCLNNLQEKLTKKFTVTVNDKLLTPRDKSIYLFIENNPGCKSGMISKKLDIPLPTVKRILQTMVEKKIIIKHGIGAGTNYSL